MLLSICIPTYNRAEMILGLVNECLQVPGPFEICVHVDGSTDATVEMLATIEDPRLRVTRSENRGRASALRTAVEHAKGRFCMLFDDDDRLSEVGLRLVLTDCAEFLPDGCVGRVYHLADEAGQRIGTSFPSERSNFLRLRADEGVHGDKKEVVLTDALRSAMIVPGNPRRVPTSLYWARLALDRDVLCVNAEIGTKIYLVGGMSDTIRRLKRMNAAPLTLLHATRLKGVRMGRYRSRRFALKSLAAFFWYSLQVRRATNYGSS